MQEISFDRVGIGTPGLIDSERGVCISAGNLPYNHTPIVAKLKEAINVKVALANDATCALLGEISAGVGKKYRDFIMITLGTGVEKVGKEFRMRIKYGQQEILEKAKRYLINPVQIELCMD